MKKMMGILGICTLLTLLTATIFADNFKEKRLSHLDQLEWVSPKYEIVLASCKPGGTGWCVPSSPGSSLNVCVFTPGTCNCTCQKAISGGGPITN